jgi:hypothetical protein
MASLYNNNKDFNDYLIGNLYIEAKNKYKVSKAKFVKIPDSVTSIGDFALRVCYSVIYITIPNYV